MDWVQIDRDGTVFFVRVAGVAVTRGRVLLHRMAGEDVWSLPGGGLRVGETCSDGLVREMREEVGAEIEVGGLLWVIENFFEHWPLSGTPTTDLVAAHHEIGLYFEMQVPTVVQDVETFAGTELAETSQEYRLEFRWVALEELSEFDVRPSVLLELLAAGPSAGVPHFIERSGAGSA